MADDAARTPHVVKLGGSILSSAQDFCQAVEAIEGALGFPAVIVVSAMKGETDRLFSTALGAGVTSREALDAVVSLGEVASCRILEAALIQHGVDAVGLSPGDEGWPIVTDDAFGDANPLMEETERAFERVRSWLGAGRTVVLCGFVGATPDGRLTTLGRGGSDLSAVLAGRVLGLPVVLAKDVGGCYTSDPRSTVATARFSTVDASDLGALARDGAKVVQGKALRYVSEGMRIMVAGIDDLRKGTVVAAGAPTAVEAVPEAGQALLFSHRERLRGVDLAIASLLGERARVVRQIFELKHRYSLPLRVPEQEVLNTQNFVESCQRAGLSREFGAIIIRLVIDESLRYQRLLELGGEEGRPPA